MINSRFILSLAALYAERAGDGGEDGDDEVDDGFDVFFFHTIWDDWWLMIDEFVRAKGIERDMRASTRTEPIIEMISDELLVMSDEWLVISD